MGPFARIRLEWNVGESLPADNVCRLPCCPFRRRKRAIGSAGPRQPPDATAGARRRHRRGHPFSLNIRFMGVAEV